MFACRKAASVACWHSSKAWDFVQRRLAAAHAFSNSRPEIFASGLPASTDNYAEQMFDNEFINEFGQAKPQLQSETNEIQNNHDAPRSGNVDDRNSSNPFDSHDSIRFDTSAFVAYCTGEGLIYQDKNIVAFDKPHDIGKVDGPQGQLGIRSLLPQLSEKLRCSSELKLISMPEPRCSGVVILSKNAFGMEQVQRAFRRGVNRITFHSNTYHALCNIPAPETLKRFQPVENDTVYFRPLTMGTEVRYQVMPRNIFDGVSKHEVKLGKYGLRIIESFSQSAGIRRSDVHVKRRQKRYMSNPAYLDADTEFKETRAVIELKTSGDDWYLYRVYCAFSGFPIFGDEVYGPQAQSVFGLPVLRPPAPVDKAKQRERLHLHLHRVALAGYLPKKEDLIIETKVFPRWYPDNLRADV